MEGRRARKRKKWRVNDGENTGEGNRFESEAKVQAKVLFFMLVMVGFI